MNSLFKTLATTSCAVALGASAANEKAAFEGTVSATLTRAGTEATQFLFTRKTNLLRTESATNKLEPINMVDLQEKKLTIIYPHNSTFVHVDLTKTTAGPGAPKPPPGFPTPPNMPISPQPDTQKDLHPSPPPSFPSPPPLPSMPQLPNPAAAGPQMPAVLGPGMGMPGVPAGAGMGMPSMPMIPPMHSMLGAAELKKTDKTKTIHGFDCTLYTISDRMQNFEIWATPDSAFFPFRLLQRNHNERHFGPQMLEDTWPELLRSKSLFPMEASLKTEENGPERLSFKVDKIEKKKIENAQLFLPPEKYVEIEAPGF